jgi:phosphatidate cytidylyltransferase
MHLKRLLVAGILIPLIYFYITSLPEIYFLFLLIIVSLVATNEFYSMYKVYGLLRLFGLLGGIAFLFTAYYYEYLLPDVFLSFIVIILCLRLLTKKTPISALSEVSPTIIGLYYISGLLTFHIFIRRIGVEWIILLYASVWIADSFAYYIGKGFGKRKLYLEVSPNKTIAGAVGSFIGSIISVLLIKSLLISTLSIKTCLIIGIVIGLTSIIGDLIESMFKRDAGVKDSGFIIPGHGGILDKIDGILTSAPVLYWTIKLI